MRERAHGAGLAVQAVAGTHTVLLGLTLARRAGCLGFGIRRTDHTEGETYWLRGMKTFASVVPDPLPGADYSTRTQPIQGFQWGDYTAKPDHDYTYEVHAFGGRPSALTTRAVVEVRVRTELEDDGVHGVWFNRGVAGSQAFARRYPEGLLALTPRESGEAFAWLGRGLDTAFTGFVAEGAAPGWGLRGAFYEFTWDTGLSALAAARDAGGDLRLVVHGRDRDDDGTDDTTATSARAAASAAGLDDGTITWRTAANQSALMHDKFLVLLRGPDPVAVWTGSTNLTQGGVFGHSNVGHVVHDPAVAAAFLAEWERLADGQTTAELRATRDAANPVAQVLPVAPGGALAFSPRPTSSTLLQWYADLFAGAEQSAHITGAFGLNQVFRDVLAHREPAVVRTVLLDKVPPFTDRIPLTDENVRLSTGAHLADGDLAQWAKEQLTGFNTHVRYIHTKIILVDPLTEDPTVVTGSANYSAASTVTNEENTLVLRGDPAPGAPAANRPAAVRRVADIYLTEYHRLFMHFVFRSWAQRRKVNTGEATGVGHLSETDEWSRDHYERGSWQWLQRRVFSGTQPPR